MLNMLVILHIIREAAGRQHAVCCAWGTFLLSSHSLFLPMMSSQDGDGPANPYLTGATFCI